MEESLSVADVSLARSHPEIMGVFAAGRRKREAVLQDMAPLPGLRSTRIESTVQQVELGREVCRTMHRWGAGLARS